MIVQFSSREAKVWPLKGFEELQREREEVIKRKNLNAFKNSDEKQ
jgi:hypothetical protein